LIFDAITTYQIQQNGTTGSFRVFFYIQFGFLLTRDNFFVRKAGRDVKYGQNTRHSGK
jgi:hypothetical protein